MNLRHQVTQGQIKQWISYQIEVSNFLCRFPMEKCSFCLASLFSCLGGALQIFLIWHRCIPQPSLPSEIFCSIVCYWSDCWFLFWLSKECVEFANPSFLLQMTVERKCKTSCRWKSKECWLCQLGCKRVETFAISTHRFGAIRELRTIYWQENLHSFIEANCQSNAASPNSTELLSSLSYLSNGQQKHLFVLTFIL